jgi:hypothetical protein
MPLSPYISPMNFGGAFSPGPPRADGPIFDIEKKAGLCKD